MPVITYTKDGVNSIKRLICSLVDDLRGQGTPAEGTAAEHMTLIYPADLDTTAPESLSDDTLVILEATPNIDPFARADTTIEDITKDPWRIAFHTSKWCDRPVVEKDYSGGGQGTWPAASTDPNNNIQSLAVYVGTPSTLYVDPDSGEPVIGWATTTNQRLPYYRGYPTAEYNGYLDEYGNPLYGTESPVQSWTYKSTYRGKDLVEPVGNLGAQWTNTFDPTANNTKFAAKSIAEGSVQPTPPARTGMAQSPTKWDGPEVTDPNQLFINRWVTAGRRASSFGGFAADSTYAQPISYRLVLTDHGMFLGCWGPDPEENGSGFSWVLVQRPVDKKKGFVGHSTNDPAYDPANPGNRPLFCVNSVNGRFWKFVVREHDTATPSSRKDATSNSSDSGQVINPYQQQSLTENGEYVITFLNNLNSSRFKYSDELDMVGTVSSDVVGGGSEIDVNVYSEEEKRTYHALWSSGSYGTKMRIMVVKDIPTPNTPT